MWSLPSSWSFRMAPLMAVLYGESEVPRSFWGTPRLLLSPRSVVLSRNFRKYRYDNRSLANVSPATPRVIISFMATLTIDRYFRAAARSARRSAIRFYSISQDKPTNSLARISQFDEGTICIFFPSQFHLREGEVLIEWDFLLFSRVDRPI